MTTLPIETRTAAWKPPTLTKALARTVAKRLDKHWAQTGVKGLGSISHAIAQGVLGGMSQMRDRVDNQAAVKKWSEALSKDDLHKMFRMIEEIKNGKGREQYRMTDDALSGLRAASDLLPVEKAAASYLDMFFKEKRIPSKVFEVTDSQGITHSIPNQVVIDMIKQTRGRERSSIEATLRKIDYGNGDVNHFLAFLAKGLAESYNGALRLASEQEAEKLQAEAEANEQQAQADRAKAEAAQMREASGGLYGYTKGTQRDVEASVRKAQRRALSVAKTLYARDERSVDFLKAHAKRANSKTARLILAAMKNLGPRVASDKTAGSGAANAKYLDSLPPAKKSQILKHIAKHYDVSVREIEDELTDRDAEALYEYAATDRAMAMEILRDFKQQRLASDKSSDMLPSERHAALGIEAVDPNKYYVSTADGDTYGPYRTEHDAEDVVDDLAAVEVDAAVDKGDKVLKDVRQPNRFEVGTPAELKRQHLAAATLPIERVAAKNSDKKEYARNRRNTKKKMRKKYEGHKKDLAQREKVAGGLYGHPTKTARLALVACSDLRAYVGEVAYSLHSRRTAKYAKVTGFLKEHGKTSKCAYSRMILSCYPDAPVSKQAAWPGATIGAIGQGISNARAQAGIEAMSDEEAKEKYPWDDCIADQMKQYGDKETAEKVCGKIKAQGKGKKASEEMLKKAFVPDSVGGWLEWADGTRTAAGSGKPALTPKQQEKMLEEISTNPKYGKLWEELLKKHKDRRA